LKKTSPTQFFTKTCDGIYSNSRDKPLNFIAKAKDEDIVIFIVNGQILVVKLTKIKRFLREGEEEMVGVCYYNCLSLEYGYMMTNTKDREVNQICSGLLLSSSGCSPPFEFCT